MESTTGASRTCCDVRTSTASGVQRTPSVVIHAAQLMSTAQSSSSGLFLASILDVSGTPAAVAASCFAPAKCPPHSTGCAISRAGSAPNCFAPASIALAASGASTVPSGRPFFATKTMRQRRGGLAGGGGSSSTARRVAAADHARTFAPEQPQPHHVVTGNGCQPIAASAQLARRGVAPLRPHAVQRAQRRSLSLDVSGPHRMTSGASAIAAW